MVPFLAQCLKITEKVAFNIASEASYVYMLRGQKFKKMPKMVNFDEFLKSEGCGQNSVTRQVTFNRTKTGRKCQNFKFQMRHFDLFSNIVSVSCFR